MDVLKFFTVLGTLLGLVSVVAGVISSMDRDDFKGLPAVLMLGGGVLTAFSVAVGVSTS